MLFRSDASADASADASGKGSRTEAPSVFRRAQISLSGGPPAGPDRMLAEPEAQLQLVKRVVRRLGQ